MSTGINPTMPEPDGLQFDRAEFAEAEAPSAVACAACKRPIADAYFEINGTVVCEPCRRIIEANLRKGAGPAGLLRATGLGTLAGIVGAAIYAGVQHLTKAEWSIVTILIGYMVGAMVRKGSGGRGGLPYQVLAAALTYLSIGLAAFFTILAFVAGDRQVLQQLLAGWPALVEACLVWPVKNLQSNPLSVVIIGFGLWQAVRLNQRARFVVTGPYRVSEAQPAGPGPEEVAEYD